MTTTVENVKMPRADIRRRYRFEDLIVGGKAIVVEAEKRNSLQACAWRAGKKLGRKFTVRLFTKGGELKAGAWRIA